MLSRTFRIAFFAIAVAGRSLAQITPVAPEPAAEFKLDTSLVYTRGSYGLPADTDIFIALVSPTYEATDWRLQAMLPYVWLNGPASVVGNAGTSLVSRHESGVGDASIAGAWKFIQGTDGWNASLGAKVKLPTADDTKGLGTGKIDTAFEADVSRKLGSLTPFGTLGYEFLGESERYPMKDGLFATAGVVATTSEKTSVGIAGNWRQPTISGGSSAAELMGFFQEKITATSHIQIFILHGYTDASPEIAVGATLGLAF